MRTILLLVALFVVSLNARTFRMKTRSTGSLRAKLIASGQYQQYLKQRNMQRTQILRKGSQHFRDYLDELYVADVQVGTPGQNFTLVLDTGSSNLWVIDEKCNTDACDGDPQSGFKKHKFDTNASSTFQKEERTFSITYGTGYCSGYLARDTVSFAGLKIQNQEFGVATVVADFFAYQPLDGILGLGWPDLAVDEVTPPMQEVLPQLDKPIFTVWLERKVKVSKGESGGLITYGDFDKDNCDSEVTYVTLSSLTYWQFPMDGFKIGNYSRKRKEQAISDTGTSWIGVPISVLSAVVRQVKAELDVMNGLYKVPCSKMNSLPDLTFTINGKEYTVPSVEYVTDVELGGGQCAITFFYLEGNGFGPSWILGDTWIRTFCNVHDIGNKRIGFAKAHHSGIN
ncbi:eukaryotic aspartyl protease [Necator americanus]|uniref:Eukaryotic aspartyl protease n=1 Tax=Necator americanus TaxID=51031 RepID=W2T840_NECAM|nr:eukaryotic aspartyl protease [Necator americanus]ETN77167.1 eukaryotic aspartyl protease [Necator americanus]